MPCSSWYPEGDITFDEIARFVILRYSDGSASSVDRCQILHEYVQDDSLSSVVGVAQAREELRMTCAFRRAHVINPMRISRDFGSVPDAFRFHRPQGAYGFPLP